MTARTSFRTGTCRSCGPLSESPNAPKRTIHWDFANFDFSTSNRCPSDQRIGQSGQGIAQDVCAHRRNGARQGTPSHRLAAPEINTHPTNVHAQTPSRPDHHVGARKIAGRLAASLKSCLESTCSYLMNQDSYPSAKPVALCYIKTVQAHQHVTTTNLSFSKWLNTFGNVKMTIALLDCLISHCPHYRNGQRGLSPTTQ